MTEEQFPGTVASVRRALERAFVEEDPRDAAWRGRVGNARMSVRVDVARGERIRPVHLRVDITEPRVLFHTGTFPDPCVWNTDFASLSPELIVQLARRDVTLVGIDTPSVDPYSSKDLPSHAACVAHDVCVLEGIVLDHVVDGVYELVALPLRLEGFDASPVRAILRTLN